MSRRAPAGRSRLRPAGAMLPLARRTVRLLSPYRIHIAVLVLVIAVASVLDLVPALLIGEMVNEPLSDEIDRGRMALLFGGMVTMYVSSAILGLVVTYLSQSVGHGLMYQLREDLHAHLLRLSVGFFTSERVGDILSRVSADVNQVQGAITASLTQSVSSGLTLLIALGFMAAIEWRLALVALGVFVLWSVPTLFVGGRIRRLQRQWSERMADMTAHLEETLSVSGIMMVKAFGRQAAEAERFAEANQGLRDAATRRVITAAWFGTATRLFGSVALAIVFWLGSEAVASGDVSVGSVVAFAVLTQRLFGPLAVLSQAGTMMLASLALFERIFDYLDTPIDVAETPGAVAIAHPRGRVAFEDVTFRYAEGAEPALTGVSFAAEPGQMIALVGPSGAGKTTVTYLLQRFYDPEAGRVTLDGHDLRELQLPTVSEAVGTVMQDPYLFHTTLAGNIRYGRLEASDSEIAQAAAAAGLGDLLLRLPDGLNTVVGQRGYRLSGGEKQRIAIARAIVKDPAVLILDEATASLDSRLEQEIRATTAELAESRTTIAVAHRLSTVQAADEILVIDQGRVVERGTHDVLLAKRGLYATLYEAQYFEQPSNGETTAGRVGEPAEDG